MVKNNRLSLLAELSKGFHTVLDIGTDHGLVLKEAIDFGFIQKGIASDLRESPLKQARKNLKNYPIDFIKSDGFLAIDKPFDLAIIAGMGSYLIADIMKNAPEGNHMYILQANDKVEYLRKFLQDNHFDIIDEFLVFEKRFYVILKVTRGEMALSESDLYLGPILKKKPNSKPYYDYKAQQIKKVINRTDDDRKKHLEKLYDIYHNS
ncbi:MAG: SAM-dependent methyltransferase [Acholeplasmataceae bacterium]|nr:SAM-dependent methyltransferase [Acholeplasmataceae bacterium]